MYKNKKRFGRPTVEWKQMSTPQVSDREAIVRTVLHRSIQIPEAPVRETQFRVARIPCGVEASVVTETPACRFLPPPFRKARPRTGNRGHSPESDRF